MTVSFAPKMTNARMELAAAALCPVPTLTMPVIEEHAVNHIRAAMPMMSSMARRAKMGISALLAIIASTERAWPELQWIAML